MTGNRGKAEVFSAGRPVREKTVKLVRSFACPGCEVVAHDLNKACQINDCRRKAEECRWSRPRERIMTWPLLAACD